jgi:solute carrier family 25 (mitochondrial carnitine/acylcarnitine transporter), member 20/29
MTDFFCGLVGGMLGTAISHPFDTIKSNIQTKKYNNIISCSTGIYNKYGIPGFYKGLLPPLCGIGLEKMLVFGIYNTLKDYGFNTTISGGLSGAMACTLITPIEYLKINGQIGSLVNLKNVYRGFNITLCREIPGFGIYFTTYEYLKNNYNTSPYRLFLYGGLAGTISWVFIYPMDIIKSNVQGSNNNISAFEYGKQLYKQNGLKHFYKGISLSLIRAFPMHGGAFYGYEIMKQLFT